MSEQELIQQLSASLSDGMITINADGRIISVNEAGLHLTGYSKGELIGQPFGHLFQPLPEVHVRRAPLTLGGSSQKSMRYQTKLRAQEVMIELLPVSGHSRRSGELAAATVKTIAIIKSVRTATAADADPHAARIQMIGHFATGAAHDINNDLTAITCSVQFAKWQISEVLPQLTAENDRQTLRAASAHLSDTETISKRTASLTKQILAYVRQRPAEKEPVDLNRLIEETISLISNLIGSHIQVEMRLSHLLPPVLAESSQLDRVLTNLIVNARDAMRDLGGGKILIETNFCYLDESFTESRPPWAKTGKFVKLSVADTGHGMNEETINKIDEVFFTTKATGSGVGLRTVYQIVKDNNGMVEAQSALGKGARFDIYLPPAEKAGHLLRRAAARDSGRLMEAAQSAGELILLADLKPSVIGPVSEILTKAGYRVLTATNYHQMRAEHEAARERGEQVQAFILDAGLARRGSDFLVREVHQLERQAGVVLTGSSRLEEDERTPRDYLFLEKPFDSFQLLEAVAVALGKKVEAELTTL